MYRAGEEVIDVGRRISRGQDCTCDGVAPFCPPCLLSLAVALRRAHPDTLSIAMLKRRIPRLGGREASLLLEFTRRLD